jgi:hypothetical protein
MFNAKEFWYKTFSKTLEDVEEFEEEETVKGAIVVFANVACMHPRSWESRKGREIQRLTLRQTIKEYIGIVLHFFLLLIF